MQRVDSKQLKLTHGEFCKSGIIDDDGEGDSILWSVDCEDQRVDRSNLSLVNFIFYYKIISDRWYLKQNSPHGTNMRKRKRSIWH